MFRISDQTYLRHNQYKTSANLAAHMRELRDLLHEFDPAYSPRDPHSQSFGLENAPAILSRDFAHVDVRRYADALWATEGEPLADYVLSLIWGQANASKADELRAFFRARVAAAGGMRITKDSGVVVGVRR